MSVNGKLVLAVKMLLERGQYKADLNQAVSDTQDAARRIEDSTRGVAGAVQDAVEGQSTAVNAAARALGILGPVGAAAVTVGLAVGAAYHQAHKETLGFEKAIILSGNAAAVTSGQLADMARSIDAVAGSHSNAAAVLTSMAASGAVARENLEKTSLAAVQMQRAGGQAIGDTVKMFSELGKDPVKASLRLNESMHYLTAATYAQIKAADDLGDRATAASIAQNAAADVTLSRAAEIEKHLGMLEKAWRGLGDVAGWAWNKMMNIGRPDTTAEQLSKATERVAYFEKQIAGRKERGQVTGDLDGQLAAAQQLQKTLQETAKLDERAAGSKRELAAQDAARIELAQALEQSASKQEKMAKAIAQANALADRSGASAAEREQLVNAAREKYAEKAGKAKQTEAEREAATIANLSGLTSDYQQKLTELQSARAKGNLTEARYIELVEALIAKQPMAKQLMDAQTKVTAAAEKATLELAKARDKDLVSMQASTEKVRAAVTAQQEQNERLGLTKGAVAELDAAKQEMLATDLELQAIQQMDKNLDEQRYELLMQQAAAYRDLAKAKREGAAKQASIDSAAEASKAADKAVAEWQRAGERIEQSLADSLMRGFEAGKGFFKSFWDGIKNTAKSTVIRFGVQGVVSGASGLLGFGNSGGAASGGGGIGTMINGASLLGRMGGTFGMGLNAGFSSLFGEAGLMGALDAGGIAIGTGNIMGGLGTIAGALGPIALGVGAVVSLIKTLDDSGTIHTGALSQYSASGGLANSTTHGAFGMGFGGVDYSADTEKLTGAMAQSIVQMLDSTATTFGKEAGYKAATAFADDTSKDGAWGGLLITKLEETIVNWDTTRTSRWAPKEFADGAAGREQYLAAVAADVRAALDSIGLPDWASGMLDKLGNGASLEQIAAVVDQINAAKATFASFAQYMPSFANAAGSALSKLVEASGGVQALAGNMATFVDNFYTDSEKLAVNTENVRATMAALGFEMPTTREGFKALVQTQIALGDAGAKALAGLLGVSGAFASITAAAVDTAQTAADLEAKQTEQRDKAFRALERAVSAEQKRLQTQLDAANDIASAVGDLFSLLHDNVRELRGEVEDTRLGQASAGRDFIAQALATAKASGYLPDADKLAEAISDVRAGLDASNFADAEERNYATLVLAGQLSGLEEVAGKQLTDAQRMVRELEGQSRQLDETLDYWRQQIEIGNGTYEGIMSVVAAVDALRESMYQSATTKPGTVLGGGGGTTPEAGRGVVPRAAYGADEALGSFEKFKAWYNGIRSNADPKVLMDQGYQVPDWMRIHNGADDGTDKEQFGSYLFFKNNPQYAKDLEQIYSTGRSSYATDGSTLVRSDLSTMPKDIADYYRSNRDELLASEGFGLDPVLAYQLYNFGPQQFGLDGKRQSFTEWLQTTKWTPEGLVANNNVVSYAQMGYSNYNLARWDTSSGNIVDVDGRMYTPDGKYIGNASRAQLDAIYGAGYKPTASAGRSSLYNSQVGGGSSEEAYYGAIKANLDSAIAAGWTAQQLVDAVVSTGASMQDVATAYGISMSQLEDNLRAGGATNIPGFADGGNHLGGLRIVGERGWELEATGPSRIWNQQQLADAISGGGSSGSSAQLTSLLQALMEEVRLLRKSVDLGTAHSGDTSASLRDVINGNCLVVEMAPSSAS